MGPSSSVFSSCALLNLDPPPPSSSPAVLAAAAPSTAVPSTAFFPSGAGHRPLPPRSSATFSSPSPLPISVHPLRPLSLYQTRMREQARVRHRALSALATCLASTSTDCRFSFLIPALASHNPTSSINCAPS